MTYPIVLFAYNRVHHTRRTIKSLSKDPLSPTSDLFIFCDGPKSVSDIPRCNEVRDYISTLKGFRSVNINASPSNLGLAASVIQGVTSILKLYPACIVVEDDLEFSPTFLSFMNHALTHHNKSYIYSVGAWTPPINGSPFYPHSTFLSFRSCTWGWATWSDRWLTVDWNDLNLLSVLQSTHLTNLFNQGGSDLSDLLKLYMEKKIDSWAIQWEYIHMINSAYCLRPLRSLTLNTGMDGSGTNCASTNNYSTSLNDFYGDAFSTLRRRPNLVLNYQIASFYNPILAPLYRQNLLTSFLAMFRKLTRYLRKLS